MDSSASGGPLAAGLGTWLWWVLACTVAWGVGGPVGAALSQSKDLIVTAYVGIAMGGIAAGVLQWLVLRPQIVGAAWWVAASIVAVAVTGGVVFVVGVVNRDVGLVLGVVVGLAVLAVLQWLVLRQEVAAAGWWVLASTVGWVAGGAGVGFLRWLVGWVEGGPVNWGWAALAAVYGALTGAVLVWLLSQRLME